MKENESMELSRVARETFGSSPQRSFQQVLEEEEQVATYNPDQIFVGWSLGGKDEFTTLCDRFKAQLRREGMTDFRRIRNDAIQMALDTFPEQVGERKDMVFLDRGSADVLLMGGQRGSGKSFNIRAISNRSAEAGVTNVLIDPEHEYVSNVQWHGIQSDLENLRPSESPKRVKTIVLMPYFVYKAREDKSLKQRGYDYVNVFQFSFSDLSADEIHFILTNLDEHRDYEMLASEITYRVKDSDYSVSSWEDVFAVAEELDEEGAFNWTGGGRVRQLKNTVRTTYQRYKFLGEDWPIQRQERDDDGKKVFDEEGNPVWEYRNLTELLRQYNTVALSLHDGDALPANLKMKQLYIAILIKKVRNLAERKVIPRPVSWRFDEAHEFVPRGVVAADYPSKDQVRQLIKKDRKRGFRVDMATQTPNDLDMDNFLDQLRHIFIPQNMSNVAPKSGEKSPRRILLELGGVFEGSDASRGKWDAIFEAMSQFQWLYIDKERSYWTILEPASPLANHFKESDD